MRIWARSGAAAAAAALFLVLTGIAPAPQSQGSSSEPQQTSPGRHSGTLPGTVLSVSRLSASLALPDAARRDRLTYLSTSWNRHIDEVTGAVFTPRGPAPAGGWPVISWEHGTTGIAQSCAPTIQGFASKDIALIEGYLDAGYAVVATDYQGLGSPGPHAYLDGPALSHASIDMVRAARAVEPDLSRTWMAVGYSEGGLGSITTGSLADSYAPELDFRGSVSIAPASQAHQTLDAIPIDQTLIANAYWFYFMGGFEAAIPGFNPAEYLTPAGLALFAQVLTSPATCLPHLQDTITQKRLTYGQLTTLTPAKVDELADDLHRIGEIPVEQYPEPILILQGTADVTVSPASTKTTADQLAAAGSDVTLKWYSGVAHDTIEAVSLADQLAFASRAFGSS